MIETDEKQSKVSYNSLKYFYCKKYRPNRKIVTRKVGMQLSEIEGLVFLDEAWEEPISVSVSDEFIRELENSCRQGSSQRLPTKTLKSLCHSKNKHQQFTIDDVSQYIYGRLRGIFSEKDIQDEPWNIYTLWGISVTHKLTFIEFVKLYMKTYAVVRYLHMQPNYIVADALTGKTFKMSYDEFGKLGITYIDYI